MALRHHHGGERRAVFGRVLAQDLEPPGANRTPGGFGVAQVPREDSVEPLLEQHAQRFAQAVEQVGGRGVGEKARSVVPDHRLPVPVGAGQPRRFGGFERLGADGVQAQARRQHQALLGAADGHVDAPLVVPVVDRGQRRDRVHHQQRRVAGAVDRLADSVYPAGRPRRGLVVDDRHRPDLPVPVRAQLRLDDRRVDPAAPVAGNEIDLEAEFQGHLAPERGEIPGLEHEHLVPGGQGVDQGRLPGPGPGGGVDHDRPAGFENLLQPLKDVYRQSGKFGTPVVDGGLSDGPENSLRHVGRPRDLEKMTPARVAHSAPPHGIDVDMCWSINRVGSVEYGRPLLSK